MPAVPIQIHGGVYRVDSNDEALGELSPIFYNAYCTEDNRVHRIPGSIEVTSHSNTVIIRGLYAWKRKDMLISVDSTGNIFKTVYVSGTYTTTSITGDRLTGLRRPTFADNGSHLVIADGGQMVYTDGTTDTAYVDSVDSDAPTDITHVVFLGTRIFASGIKNDTIYWSEVNDATDWEALSFSTAESSVDKIMSMIRGYQELIVFGVDSIERWNETGADTVIAQIPGTTIDTIGLGASASVQFLGGYLIFLDDSGRVVQLSGQETNNIGLAIQRDIDSFSKIDDATADVLEIAGMLFYSLNFPSEKRSYWYNARLRQWSQVGRWVPNNNEFICQTMGTYSRMWNKNLIGDSRMSGKILELSSSVYQDDGDDLRYLQKTAVNNHGTPNRKRGQLLNVQFKRADFQSDPKLMIKYSNNNNWMEETSHDMGGNSQTFESTLFRSRPGIFTDSSIELSYTANDPLTIKSVKVDFDVLVK